MAPRNVGAKSLLVGWMCAVGIAACVRSPALQNPERGPGSPPPVERLRVEDLHANMRDLARHAAVLDATMRRGNEFSRAQVVGELEQMIAITDRLASDDPRGQHPILVRNIDAFTADLRLAREHALAEPPNYFLAGTVAGSCQLCHRSIR